MADVLRHAAIHDSNNKDQLRKTKKPMMEKRRRARINSCLNDIKSLLLQAFNKDGSQFSKLEKADILEMTVKYLRSVQQAQLSAAVQADHAVTTRYRAGFTECAKETLRYVDNVHVSETLRSRLSNHLNNCVQAVNSCPPPTPPSIQPVYVQIPSYRTHPEPITAQPHFVLPQNVPSPPLSTDSEMSPVPVSHSGLLKIPKVKQEYDPSVNPMRLSPISHNYSTPFTNSSHFANSTKICRDVVCVERSSDLSPRGCQHIRSDSPAESVWRPW